VTDEGLSLSVSKWHALRTVGVSSFITKRLVTEMRKKGIAITGFSEGKVQQVVGEGGDEPSWWEALFGCAG